MKILDGVKKGYVYKYIGSETLGDAGDGETVDLTTQDYNNTDLWEQVNLNNDNPVEVQAYIRNSSVNAAGDLTQTAISDQSIDALVVAGSAAVTAGGVGVGVSGAGAAAINKITTD